MAVSVVQGMLAGIGLVLVAGQVYALGTQPPPPTGSGRSGGARTKASRVLHGVWLLVFAAVLPGVLGVISVAAPAGLLVHAECRLMPVREVGALWRGHRGEVVVLVVAAGTIVLGNLFGGVLVGLALAVVKTAWNASHVRVETEDRGDAGIVVRVPGHATFLRLPKLLDALEALPRVRAVRLEPGGLRDLDHACAAALEGWAVARGPAVGGQVWVATRRSTS